MREVVNKYVNFELQEECLKELEQNLKDNGYVKINNLKLDPEKLAVCVATALNELQNSQPIIES